MKNESVKKLLEKSKNVLEEKLKKTNTFTIIAMNFVQKQLIIECNKLDWRGFHLHETYTQHCNLPYMAIIAHRRKR